jgi:Ca-activated chloride channel family protein
MPLPHLVPPAARHRPARSPRPLHLTLHLALAVAAAFALPAAARAQEAPAAAEARLRASDGPDTFQLLEESLRLEVDQQHLTATLRQVHTTSGTRPQEGQFLLRAGDGARVHGYAYWNGDQKIVGEVFEKDTAARVYQEVTGLNRDPGLLEQVGEGAFSFRIFPIQPGEQKRIEVRYGQWLQQRGDTIELHAPSALPTAGVEILLSDRRPISDITSDTHQLEIGPAPKGPPGALLIRARGRATSKQLTLRYRVKDRAFALQTAVHHDAGHDAYLRLSLATPAGIGAHEVAAKDVTLVLDRSGSMEGEPVAQARRAAQDVIRRLRPTDRVNVLLFDDKVDRLYDRPRAVGEVQKEALAFVGRMRAGGGTDIALALKEALAAQHPAGEGAGRGRYRSRVVIFVTDGQSDAKAALKIARGEAGDTRVFTVGVGSGVEKPLLSRLAAEKRGRFTFIENPTTLDVRMASLFQQIEAPVLLDVKVEATGLKLMDVYPRTLSDLFRNDELALNARVFMPPPADGGSTGAQNGTVTVRGRLGNRPVSFTTRVEVPAQVRRPWVGRLWAQARIQDLLEEIALNGETEELKKEVIELALAYNVATKYTSFLAIPESELTAAANATLAEARVQKQRIFAARKDAAQLSRADMPPGDPVLSVKAPRDARQVTAYFPFGLVEDLTWEPAEEKWQVRFLVPKGTRDGRYRVQVLIVHQGGHTELAEVDYTIDSQGPELELKVTPTAGGADLEVRCAERARRVAVQVVGQPALRLDLTDDGTGLRFTGTLRLPPGRHALRVVASDRARNESEKEVDVTVGQVQP